MSDGNCFWTDLVLARQVCPSLSSLDFIARDGAGNGGALLLDDDWLAPGANMIRQAMNEWLGAGYGDGPVASIVNAKDASGTVVYDRTASGENCHFRCGGAMTGGPDDGLYIFGFRPPWNPEWGPWTGAEENVPYVATLEFLNQTGGVIGTATGQVTFTPGY